MNSRKFIAAIGILAAIVMVSIALSATAPTSTTPNEETISNQPQTVEQTVEIYYESLSNGNKNRALEVTTGQLHNDIEKNFTEMSGYVNRTNTTVRDIEPVGWDNRTRVEFTADLSPNNKTKDWNYATTIKNVSVDNTPRIAEDPYIQ